MAPDRRDSPLTLMGTLPFAAASSPCRIPRRRPPLPPPRHPPHPFPRHSGSPPQATCQASATQGARKCPNISSRSEPNRPRQKVRQLFAHPCCPSVLACDTVAACRAVLLSPFPYPYIASSRLASPWLRPPVPLRPALEDRPPRKFPDETTRHVRAVVARDCDNPDSGRI